MRLQAPCGSQSGSRFWNNSNKIKKQSGKSAAEPCTGPCRWGGGGRAGRTQGLSPRRAPALRGCDLVAAIFLNPPPAALGAPLPPSFPPSLSARSPSAASVPCSPRRCPGSAASPCLGWPRGPGGGRPGAVRARSWSLAGGRVGSPRPAALAAAFPCTHALRGTRGPVRRFIPKLLRGLEQLLARCLSFLFWGILRKAQSQECQSAQWVSPGENQEPSQEQFRTTSASHQVAGAICMLDSLLGTLLGMPLFYIIHDTAPRL
ncbi:uncharacterized protein ACIB01_001380 [Guaruba guarouba]